MELLIFIQILKRKMVLNAPLSFPINLICIGNAIVAANLVKRKL